ncbi:UNC93-like protein, partial [Gryllus bimaculatus]
MQAEVPTGKRHWSHQSPDAAAIASLGDSSPVAMKDTALDAAETATHVPDTSDEPDRAGCRASQAVSGSPQPSPVAARADAGDATGGRRDVARPGYETPPPSPEEGGRTPVAAPAAAPLEGAPYDDEIPPPLPISDAPTDVVVVSENQHLLQATTAQNSHQPANLDDDEQPGDAPAPTSASTSQRQSPSPAGCDNEAFTHDGHESLLRIAFFERGFTNPGFEVDEVETPVEAVPYASASPSAASATCSNPEPSVENTLPGAVPEEDTVSECPPQRAVYEAAASAAAASAAPTAAPAPLDPAARAIKEQGLGRGEKWRILRNVVLISAAFMLAFTAFFGAANLQSSVNADQGLGTVSLTAAYAALIVSNLFLPSIVI